MCSFSSRVTRSFRFFAGVLLAIFSIGASADFISLTPPTQTVSQGTQVSLQLNMDFSNDPTLGGGLDVFYDSSRLSFVSFVFDAALGDDPLLQRQPDVTLGQLTGLGFGNFNGLSGPSVIGTLTFDTLLAGTASLSLTDNVSPVGPFYSAVDFSQQTVDYSGAELIINNTNQTGNTVPEPGVLWLMMSSVGLLGVMVRKQRQI